MQEYHPDDPTQVANWFDPQNEQHLRAWVELQQKGHWPQWFQDEMVTAGVEPNYHWSIVIEARMAQAWLNHKLGEVTP